MLKFFQPYRHVQTCLNVSQHVIKEIIGLKGVAAFLSVNFSVNRLVKAAFFNLSNQKLQHLCQRIL